MGSDSFEYVIDLPAFVGPLRLLAELVFDNKLDVCDVPIASVTDEFVRRGTELVDGWTLEEATSFLGICAALLELKVGRLLPRPVPTADDEILSGPSPDLAFARSVELAAFRRIATTIEEKMAEASLMIPRTAAPPEEFAHLYPDPLERVSPERLWEVARAVLEPPPRLDLSHITPIRASLAEALDDVRSKLVTTERASFADLVADCDERIDIVIRFLAVLELHREGEVELSQGEVFGDIEVQWRERTPSVGAPVEVPGLALTTQGSEMEGR